MNRHHSGDGNWIDKLAEQARIMGEARMLRDDQPLTDELRSAILKRFSDYLERAGLSQDKAARKLAISAAVISQVLSGSYAGDTEKIVRQIDKWVESQIVKEAAPKDPGFVKTSVARQIYGVAKYVKKYGGIGLVHGPAGIGKTRTLNAVRSDIPGSVMVTVSTAGRSTLSVLSSIGQQLRMGDIKLTARQIEQAIIAILKDTDRLVIVDEVHKLAGRRNDEALHALRELYDATGCPMVWCGMTAIADYINQAKNTYDPIEQIDSRFSIKLDLTDQALSIGDGGPGLFTIEDIQKFLAAQKIRVTPDAELFLHKIANEPRMGAMRAVDNLVKFAREVAGEKTIDAKLLRSIFVQQRGRRFVESFEQLVQQRTAAVA